MKPKNKTVEIDDFDILSSVWILSCNDENPIITYEGIVHRLNLNPEFDIKQLISSRGDLFRLKIPKSRLDKWKTELLNGKWLPSFIRDTTSKEDREKKINSLTVDDVFRSQFRSEDKAEKSSIEILDWGIQHINRLRQTQIDLKENRLKKIPLIWVPVLSLLITGATVVSSNYHQSKSEYNQIQTKKYEVTFKIKQENYSRFMQGVYDSFFSTSMADPNLTHSNLKQLETVYFNIEPFLDSNQRLSIWNKYQKFYQMCIEYQHINEINRSLSLSKVKADSLLDKYSQTFLDYKDYFHAELYHALF